MNTSLKEKRQAFFEEVSTEQRREVDTILYQCKKIENPEKCIKFIDTLLNEDYYYSELRINIIKLLKNWDNSISNEIISNSGGLVPFWLGLTEKKRMIILNWNKTAFTKGLVNPKEAYWLFVFEEVMQYRKMIVLQQSGNPEQESTKLYKQIECNNPEVMREEYKKLKKLDLIPCSEESFIRHFTEETTDKEKIEFNISPDKLKIYLKFLHDEKYAAFYSDLRKDSKRSLLSVISNHFIIKKNKPLSNELYIIRKLKAGDYSILSKRKQ